MRRGKRRKLCWEPRLVVRSCASAHCCMCRFAYGVDESFNRHRVPHLRVGSNSGWVGLGEPAATDYRGCRAGGAGGERSLRDRQDSQSGGTKGTASQRIADKIPGIAFAGCSERRRIPNNKNYVDGATATRAWRPGRLAALNRYAGEAPKPSPRPPFGPLRMAYCSRFEVVHASADSATNRAASTRAD